MPRRLSYRSNLPIWIAFILGLLLFAAAMVLVLSRLGAYDSSATGHQVDPASAIVRA